MTRKRKARLRTVKVLAILSVARLVVATMPFKRWRNTLGWPGSSSTYGDEPARLASVVEWAAGQLPGTTKCLPRAMALSWMLRRRQIAHAVVFAVRPPALRRDRDALHAWLEIDGSKIIGDLPGPWLETLRLGAT
jgi:hypothetical protein